MMPKSHRRKQYWFSEGSWAEDPTLSCSCSLALVHRKGWCSCWGTRGNSQEKVKAFCVSSAGTWGVRVKTALEWHRGGLAAEGLCQMELWGISLNRPASLSGKAPGHPVWDVQAAVFVFGGNSSVTSSFFTGDVGLMQTIFEIRIFWVRHSSWCWSSGCFAVALSAQWAAFEESQSILKLMNKHAQNW